MRNLRHILSFVLAFTLVLGLASPAFAAQEQIPTRDTYTTTISAVVPDIIGRGSQIKFNLAISRKDVDGHESDTFRFIENLVMDYDADYFTFSMEGGLAANGQALFTATDTSGHVVISSDLTAGYGNRTSADLPTLVLTVRDDVVHSEDAGWVKFDDTDYIVAGANFSSADGTFNQILTTAEGQGFEPSEDGKGPQLTIKADDVITVTFITGEYINDLDVTEVEILRGESLTLPEASVKDEKHYTFNGWNTTETGNELYQPGANVSFTMNAIVSPNVTPNNLNGEGHPACAEDAHTWGDWVVVIEPTYTTPGMEYRKCTTCGFKQTVGIPVLEKCDHQWGEWVIDTEATTTTNGSQHRICDICKTRQDAVIDAFGVCNHQWGEWTVETPAGYKVEGKQTRTCNICHEKYTMVIPAWDTCNHVWGSWDITQEATYEAAGSMTRHCTVDQCDATETVEIPMLEDCEHSFGAWIVDVPAEVGKDGSMFRVCGNCGFKQTAVIEALEELPDGCANGHLFGSWRTVTPATETTTGVEKRTCGRCGYVQTAITAMLGKHDHTFGDWIVAEAPKYQVEGKQYRVCSGCGFTQTMILPALEECAHVWGEWGNFVDPTYEADGSQSRTCTICGAEDVLTLPKLEACDHTFTSWVELVKAGYGTPGSQSRYCTQCGYTQVCAIPALTVCDHSFGAWTVTEPAGVGVVGHEERTCSICGYTQTAEISALPAEGTPVGGNIIELGEGTDPAHPGIVPGIDGELPKYETEFIGRLSPYDPTVFEYKVIIANPEAGLPVKVIIPNEDGSFVIPAEYMTDDLVVTVMTNVIGTFRVTAFSNDIVLIRWERDKADGGNYSFDGTDMVYTDLYGEGAYVMVVTCNVDEYADLLANASALDMKWAAGKSCETIAKSKDINGDTKVSFYDANYITEVFNGGIKFSSENANVFRSLLLCDQNADGKVDVSDFVLWYANK